MDEVVADKKNYVDEEKQQYKRLTEKLNVFTTALNELSQDYSVTYWESGEGVTIGVGKTVVAFYLSGAVEFGEKE